MKNYALVISVTTLLILFVGCENGKQEPAKDWNPNIENIPQPFLQEHPGWIDLYRKAFEIAFLKVQHGTAENGFVDNYMDEAFSDKIFQWDTNFMMMFARYSNGELPSVVSLENFYMSQDEDGWIGRELLESDGSSLWPGDASGSVKAQCSINPPLFSWSEWQNFLVTGDAARFTKEINGKPILQILVDYFYWIKNNRRWDNGLYWTTPFANGMDDSPRLFPDGVPSWDWSGDYADICSHQDASWIDITAQQAMNAYFIAKIANQIGNKVVAEKLEIEHAELKSLINEMLWDEADGFYYDMDKEGALFKIKTPASFWPMVAHVSNSEQTERIVKEHVINPQEFWTQHHIPTVAFNEPLYEQDGGYWCGAVWAPTSYVAIKGLEEQGYNKLAHQVAYNHIQNLYWVYRESNTLWENYQPSATKEGGHARPDFVGWTGCGPITTLIENVMGIHVNAPENNITWNVLLSEEHGISNLQFGNNAVNLYCSDRATPNDGVKIKVDSEKDFVLHVLLGETEYSYTVKKGSNVFDVGCVDEDLFFITTQSSSLNALPFGNEKRASLSQKFTVPASSNLKAIDVKIKRNGNILKQSDLLCTIHAVDEAGVEGGVIASRSVIAEEVDNFYQIVNIPIAIDDLTKGSEYVVKLTQKALLPQDYNWIIGEDGNQWMKVYFSNK